MSGSTTASRSPEGQVGLTREEWLTRNRELAPPLTAEQCALAARVATGVAQRSTRSAKTLPPAIQAQPGRGRSASPSAA